MEGNSEWKRKILGSMGVRAAPIGGRELVLLALYLVDATPLKTPLHLHYLVFLHPLPGVRFVLKPFGPFSEELSEALNNLVNEGFVETRLKKIMLGKEGIAVAENLVSRVANGKVLLQEVVVVSGTYFLRQMERAKKTVLASSSVQLFFRVLEKIVRDWPSFLDVNDKEREYLKQMYSMFSEDFRGRVAPAGI